MAEPTEMLFGLRTRVGPRNHVLDGGPDSPVERGSLFGLWARMAKGIVLDAGPALLRDVAMATHFGTNIAINWLCVDNSD